jgi:hypothetical protein
VELVKGSIVDAREEGASRIIQANKVFKQEEG